MDDSSDDTVHNARLEIDSTTNAGTLNSTDLSIDRSNTFDTALDHDIPAEGFEFSVDIDLGVEQTVVWVCHHCGEVNPVRDAAVLSALRLDPCCVACGFPLGMVR